MAAINNNIKKLMLHINNAEKRKNLQIGGILCPITT